MERSFTAFMFRDNGSPRNSTTFPEISKSRSDGNKIENQVLKLSSPKLLLLQHNHLSNHQVNVRPLRIKDGRDPSQLASLAWTADRPQMRGLTEMN